MLFPNFAWTNEAEVVKQGASVPAAMAGSVLVVLLPAVLSGAVQVMAAGTANPVNGGIAAVVIGVSAVLYCGNVKKKV